MEFITDYWEQILFIGAAIIVATRLREQVNEARRDIDALTDQLDKRDTYVETVRLRAQFDAQMANLVAFLQSVTRPSQWKMIWRLKFCVCGSITVVGMMSRNDLTKATPPRSEFGTR